MLMIPANNTPVKSAITDILLVISLAGFVCPSIGAPKEQEPLGKKALQKVPAIVSDGELFTKADPAKLRIVVNLAKARLLVYAGDIIALESPIGSGRKKQPTATGSFKVSAKAGSQKPAGFGRILDEGGSVVLPVAYETLDPLLPGQRFEPREKLHVISLGKDAPTIHAGPSLPLACSDGAIIVPGPLAKLLFERLPTGCPVEIIPGTK